MQKNQVNRSKLRPHPVYRRLDKNPDAMILEIFLRFVKEGNKKRLRQAGCVYVHFVNYDHERLATRTDTSLLRRKRKRFGSRPWQALPISAK